MAWEPNEPQGSTPLPSGAQKIRGNWSALETALGTDLNCGLYRASNAAQQAKMWFYRDTAPTGWAIITTIKDALIAVKADTTTYTITGFSNADPGVITLDTSSHGFAVGMKITTAGITEGGSGTSLNGSFTITAVNSAQLSVDVDTSSGYHTYTSGGTCACASNSVYSEGAQMKGSWQQEDHVLDITEIPAHSHSYTTLSFQDGSSGGGSRAGPSLSATTGEAGGGQGHDHGSDWRPYSAVGIVCSRS